MQRVDLQPLDRRLEAEVELREEEVTVPFSRSPLSCWQEIPLFPSPGDHR